MERGQPIHFYFEYLLHNSACFRELNIDTLKIVNYVELPINEYFAADLPDDYQDEVGVYIPIGQLLHHVPHNDSITEILNHDSTGAFTPYSDHRGSNTGTFFGFNTNWTFFYNINDYGESTGRYFGAHGAGKRNGYKIVKSRNQIQFTQSFTSDKAVLVYISNGQRCDNATQVETKAIATIQAYCAWKSSPYADNKDSPPARNFYNERRKLIAREDELTITDVRNIILKSYTASIKN